MPPKFNITRKGTKILLNTLNDYKREVNNFRYHHKTKEPTKKDLIEKNIVVNLKNILTLYRELEITGRELTVQDKKAIEGYKKIHKAYSELIKKA